MFISDKNYFKRERTCITREEKAILAPKECDNHLLNQHIILDISKNLSQFNSFVLAVVGEKLHILCMSNN